MIYKNQIKINYNKRIKMNKESILKILEEKGDVYEICKDYILANEKNDIDSIIRLALYYQEQNDEEKMIKYLAYEG